MADWSAMVLAFNDHILRYMIPTDVVDEILALAEQQVEEADDDDL